jgi:hypothetical protein
VASTTPTQKMVPGTFLKESAKFNKKVKKTVDSQSEHKVM